MYSLKSNQYALQFNSLSSATLLPKDLVAWKNEDNQVLHATFYLGDGYYFNKHGQSFITPWQITKLENLFQVWGKDRIHVYRKKVNN